MTREQELAVELLVRDRLKGGKEDEALRALARILRSSLPLDIGLRFALANLIDPDVGKEMGRRLVLQRSQGRTKQVNDREIAAALWHLRKQGVPRKRAEYRVETKFGVRRTAVTDAQRKWKPHFRRYPKEFLRPSKTWRAD
jgi:hypothetical protein